MGSCARFYELPYQTLARIPGHPTRPVGAVFLPGVLGLCVVMIIIELRGALMLARTLQIGQGKRGGISLVPTLPQWCVDDDRCELRFRIEFCKESNREIAYNDCVAEK